MVFEQAPIKEGRITKLNAPWLTANSKIFMKQGDNALQKFKRPRDTNDWNNCTRLQYFTI